MVCCRGSSNSPTNMYNPGNDGPDPSSFCLPSRAGRGRKLAQAAGDQDYEPDPDTVAEYENLGEEHGSDYDLDEGAFVEAADRARADPLEVVPPSAAEVEQFRAGLEAHWRGSLPALWICLDSIDPAGAGNPRQPGEGEEPDDDYNQFGNLAESAEQERQHWRGRVEEKLAQFASR